MQNFAEINAAFFGRRKKEAEPVPADRAENMIRAAQAKARELSVSVSVTVVDGEQRIVAFAGMEGAPEPSNKAATSRAIATVAAFKAPKAELTQVMIQSGPKGAVVPAIDAKLAQIGAMPIMEGVNAIGAIGVAGGTDDQDQQACRAGLSAFV